MGFASFIGGLTRLLFLLLAAWAAYDIRMYAIRIYGMVIHEFDPWFNFRATQYLADHGMERFFKWYDYMSWSPLGRPVGTTIYPGMQIAAVNIWRFLNIVGVSISLNDVCCLVPVGFGVLATLLVAFFTYVTSRSATSAVVAAGIMAVIPAHLMRSVGGGFDNESVAISCMCLTFLMWVVSISGADDTKVTYMGVFTGLAYTCMVASWGGFIFVLNMIGLHAFVLVLLGRFSKKLYSAYSIWYIVGTLGAIQIPVVGLGPLKSLEQLAPMGVFILFQLLYLCDTTFVLKLFKLERDSMTSAQKMTMIFQVLGGAGAVLSVIVAVLWPTGYFGPLSSRVRGLFVTHTRTGNPLVDSVAEHQPANREAYWQFLYYTCYVSPIGFVITLIKCISHVFFKKNENVSLDPAIFVLLNGLVTYQFASKMNRLMLLMGPVSAVLSGIAIGNLLDFSWSEAQSLFVSISAAASSSSPPEPVKPKEEKSTAASGSGSGAEKQKSHVKTKAKKADSAVTSTPHGTYANMIEKKLLEITEMGVVKLLKKVVSVVVVLVLVRFVPRFYEYSHFMAQRLSNPSVMFQARLNDGTVIMVDDYREAYFWLRDHTPADARVMAWWDYGYQITGMGNRTTIADGNTWNHEHIALLGRALVSPEKRAHNIIKHLADYVLVWSGGGGDDLAKSPHLARIANSVFDDVCPNDPTCTRFGFINRQMQPTPMMAESLLYKLHGHKITPGVEANPSLFREVYTSKYQKVRIFQVVGVSQKSKRWTADPANRLCDAPGSWHCTGQYPPALRKLLAKKKDFQQLEDFNVKKDEKAAKYHEEYMKRMNQQNAHQSPA